MVVSDSHDDSRAALPGEEELTPAEYCRQVESYLCRKNDGHLIRIVGPIFDQVCGWAATGIPLRIVYRGVDRYFERYYARGPRRWPVRIEFCESDVLDAFDAWRRAVGVAVAPRPSGGDAAPTGPHEEAAARRGPSLAQHLERAALRLSSVLASTRLPEPLASQAAAIAGELDDLRARARGARGEARRAVVARLDALEATLSAAAVEALAEPELEAIRTEAASQLSLHRSRMPGDEYTRAAGSLTARLARERFSLPVLRWE